MLAACCLSSVSLFTSCDDYDDTELWNKVNGLEERALQTLINTMDYITSVAPIMQANDTIGYTINFHQSNPISIYNGTTSQIGITQDEEGNWLWTLDGEILTTPDGTPIPANGQDAAAPQLSTGKALQDEGIKTDAAGDAIIADIAYLSVDEGETWYRVTGEKGEQGDKGNTGSTGPTGPAGANGDSFFQSVTDKGDYVEIVLKDGTTFAVQKYDGTLSFSLGGTPLTDLAQTIDLVNGNLTYTPADAEVSARIIDGEGWSASATSGTITVSPKQFGEEALLEVTLMDNGRVIETYRLKVTKSAFAGEGTMAEPYEISGVEQLEYIAEQVEAKNYFRNTYFKLTNDITFPTVEAGKSNWTPIGKQGDATQGPPTQTYFYGTLDGDGHAIKGLVVNDSERGHVGFFGILAGTVKNLTLESPKIAGNRNPAYAGAIAGWNYTGTIINCHVTGEAEISSYSGTIGGITASNSGTVSACSVVGTIKGQLTIGGIVGDNSAGKSVTACHFAGKIEWSGTNTAGTDCGGIVGSNSGGSVTACYSTGTFGFTSGGGIIGTNSSGTVSTCYWGLSAGQTTPQYGIGSASSNDNATKVDGTATTWTTALTAMNAALTSTGWQYEENTDEATKASLPLILVSSQAGQ